MLEQKEENLQELICTRRTLTDKISLLALLQGIEPFSALETVVVLAAFVETVAEVIDFDIEVDFLNCE